MSKLKQSIAVTIMLAGLILYTVPVQSAPCFLPAGSEGCEAGGVDIASDNGSDETCEGFNISESTRNSKQYSSGCYSCSECTVSKTNKKMYKCTAVSNATWNSLYSVCCTDGLTYDADERQCCANGKCEHTCPEPRVWSTSLKSCECPSGREENDRGDCCDYSEHADGSICCPENKHNENGTCVCDDGYIPDGTGCKLPNCGGYDVTDTSKYDTNCYVCEACADDSKKFRCTESIKSGYKLDGSKCVMKQSCSDYGLVSETSCDKSKNTFTANRTDDFGNKCGTCVKKKSCADYGLVSESACDTSKNTFTASRTDDFGEKCGTCVAKTKQTCQDYAAANPDKIYVTNNDNADCADVYNQMKEDAGKENEKTEYDFFTVTPVDVSSGECYLCHMMTCHEVDTDYNTYNNLECNFGYYKSKADGWYGSDGQCYECLKERTHITIEFYTPQCDGAGDYLDCQLGCVSNSMDCYDISQIGYCSEQNAPNYNNCNSYHKSQWEAMMILEKNAADFDYKTWTLPFDIMIRRTYKIPYINEQRCQNVPLTDDMWGVDKENYVIGYVPYRTVDIVIPKGTKLGQYVYVNAIDFSDTVRNQNLYEKYGTLMKTEYYINGRKVSGGQTIGDIYFKFQEI